MSMNSLYSSGIAFRMLLIGDPSTLHAVREWCGSQASVILSRISFTEILNVTFFGSQLNLPRAQALTRQISTPLLSRVLMGLGGCLDMILVSVQSMIGL